MTNNETHEVFGLEFVKLSFSKSIKSCSNVFFEKKCHKKVNLLINFTNYKKVYLVMHNVEAV